jgi:cytidylate kinase
MERTRRRWQAEFRSPAASSSPVSEVPYAKPPPPDWTIAISRDAGANGSVITQALGQRLNWVVYDYALLEQLAKEMGSSIALLETVDEKRKSWLQESAEAFAAVPAVCASAYVQHLLIVLARLSVQGGCVILGRGAAQVLPKATTLRVRLVAPLEERTEIVRQRLGLDRQAAEKRVAQIDGQRSTFVREHFHKDPTDPTGYDLVLNTARLSTASCVEVIVSALHQLQAQTGSPAPRTVASSASAGTDVR